MTGDQTTISPKGAGFGTTVLKAGLVAGILDALAAIIHYLIKGGKDPVKIFYFIASGVYGKSAFQGNWIIPVMGFIFHMLIAMIWTCLFFFCYERVGLLRRSWYLSGLGYGIIVWLGMNLIVVPLSFTPPVDRTVSGALVGILILMVCIGLPVAYFANNRFRKL